MWSGSHNGCIPLRMQDPIQSGSNPVCTLTSRVGCSYRATERPTRHPRLEHPARCESPLRKGRLHGARLEPRRRIGPPVPAGSDRARSRGGRRPRSRQHRRRRPERSVRRLVLDVAAPHASQPPPAGRRRRRPPLLHRTGRGSRAHRLGVPDPRGPARWWFGHARRHVRPLRRDRGRPDADGPHHRGRRVQPDRDRAGGDRRLGAGEGAQQPGPHAAALPRLTLLRGDDRRLPGRAWVRGRVDQVRQGRAARAAGGGSGAARVGGSRRCRCPTTPRVQT